jgi:hypothetical protein
MFRVLNDRRARLVILVPLTLLLSGCGRGDVSGNVRFTGSPVTGGWVTLTYTDGEHSPVSGIIHPDGSYRIDGCPAGAARVTVRVNPTPTTKSGGPKTPGVPTRYADAEKTPLAATVKGDQ